MKNVLTLAVPSIASATPHEAADLMLIPKEVHEQVEHGRDGQAPEEAVVDSCVQVNRDVAVREIQPGSFLKLVLKELKKGNCWYF